MNLTSDAKTAGSSQHPPCELRNSTNIGDDSTNGTYLLSNYNGSDPCATSHSSRRSHTRVKTYHMQPPLFDDSLAFYSKYDPATGIRTAAILGSCLFIVVVWGLYKAKCKKSEWTSQDRLFVEHYKKRFNGRKGRRGTDFAFMREPFRNRSGETSVAMEQTAKWIQSQPLQSTTVTRNNFKSTMGNLCLESFKATMYPVCDSNNINSQVPNGKVIKDAEEGKTNHDMQIQRLNERNLKLDLQSTYKEMLPFKQNLWKCRSFDDKVNMRNLSHLSSLDDLQLSVYPSDMPKNDVCDKSDIDSSDSCKINIEGDNVITDIQPMSMGDEPISPLKETGSCHTSITSLTPQLLNWQNACTPSDRVRNKGLTKHSRPKSTNGFPMLQPLATSPQTLSIPTVLSNPKFEDIPLIDIDPGMCDNFVMRNSSNDSVDREMTAFHIGSPSTCSSLDNDEYFSLTAATASSSLSHPLSSTDQHNTLSLIPPLPPYIPPVTSSYFTVNDTINQAGSTTNIKTPNHPSDMSLSTISATASSITSNKSAISLNSKSPFSCNDSS